MGGCPTLAPGGQYIGDKKIQLLLKECWNTDYLPENINTDQFQLLKGGNVKNILIVGEDPIGCAINKELITQLISKTPFVVVQDYFMTETAAMANIILPASLPFETSGSFTNTQKYIQQFDQVIKPPSGLSGTEQLLALLKAASIDTNCTTPADVMLETASIISKLSSSRQRMLKHTRTDNFIRYFENGADSLTNQFFKNH